MGTALKESDQSRYCLWIDQDNGDIHIVPLSTPIEPVPIGFYVPHGIGTLQQMERRKQQILLDRVKRRKFSKRISK
ncbi:MAG: hypothetical protein AB2L24_11685 [Mangrovibacterium sp.]